MLKMSEIRQLSDEELKERIEEEQRRYVRMKWAHKITPLENPMRLRFQRKFIARLLTEWNRRQREKKQGQNSK
ncbi:MAG: 50S ribosomal protein L29 [Chlorobi bacterium]|nr:50S ribosomal protein L29 [Chlorobiota bacterium]